VTDTRIAPALAPDVPVVRELFEEYQRGVGVSLAFPGFEQELAQLPGRYVPPGGGLWIAWHGRDAVGCVALRRLDEGVAELKRLYVRPGYRGLALGRRLASIAIDAARQAGYAEVKLDTLPTMAEAHDLYSRLGFRPTDPYNDNPVEGVRFLALDLGALSARAP
jgi:putative acetyltransferase